MTRRCGTTSTSSIKQREEFRPFAPAVVSEYASEYFEIAEGKERYYPHMLFVAQTRPSTGTCSARSLTWTARPDSRRWTRGEPSFLGFAQAVRGAHGHPGPSEHLLQSQGPADRQGSGSRDRDVRRLEPGRARHRRLPRNATLGRHCSRRLGRPAGSRSNGTSSLR